MSNYKLLAILVFCSGISIIHASEKKLNVESCFEELSKNKSLIKNMAPSPGVSRPKSNPTSDNPSTTKNKQSCDSQSIKEIVEVYKSAYKEINKLLSYVGFGILIAIFLMSANFRAKNKCLVLFSCAFSILSLALNYVGCWYQLYQYSNAPEQYYEEKINYTNGYCDAIFAMIAFILLISVILFCILGYKFLFDTESEKSKK